MCVADLCRLRLGASENRTMNPAEKKWLTDLAKAAGLRVTFEDEEKKREEVMARITAVLERDKEDIRHDMTFRVVKDGKSIHSMTETSEQLDEIESEEVVDTTGLTAEAATRVNKRTIQ